MERYLSLQHLQRYPMTFYDQQKVMKAPYTSYNQPFTHTSKPVIYHAI